MSERTFPIQDSNRRPFVDGDRDTPVKSVPWSIVEPLRERCLRYHEQTLERLAERGGLGLVELWFHVHKLRSMPDARTKPFLDQLRSWARSGCPEMMKPLAPPAGAA